MSFIGNKKIVKNLEESLKSGKISQAYLFHGPEHVGKFTLAKIFAASLIRGATLLPNKVLENETSLPDLIIIEPEKEEKKGIIKIRDIKIEQVREAQGQLATYPYAGKFKVLIINDANRMTVAAQNSLLKILEEPNSTSVIILVVHEMKKMISTIISRCQKFSFALVDTDEIGQKFLEINGSRKKINTDTSLGRPGIALKINRGEKDTEEMDKIQKVGEIFSMTVNEKLDFAEAISKNPDLTRNVLEAWIWQLRNEADNDRGVTAQNFYLIEKIEQIIIRLNETNANPRLAIEALLISI